MTSSTGDTTVFIDTNLNTHLVTIVSDSVTVSDLKRIIVSEHHQCFPAIGNIKIDGLKVKRRGNLYRMSDSMRVKGAFAPTKDNWFISVDASRLEQTCGVQHVDKDKAGDRIALPWVTDNNSIDQGSPSMLPPKLVPFVNPEVSNVGQITIVDSLKGCQKYTENDRPFNNEISSKKRTRAVQNDSLLEDASGSGPSVKKKRKTQKKEPTVKASENLGNENTIISINKLSENSSVHDQVATVVPSGVVDIGAETPLKNAEASETVPEISMVLEKNIQQEVPSEVYQKDKDKELVQKTVAGSEIPSSSMRTSDCEPGTSALSHQKGAKSSTKRKAAEKEVAATSLIKTQHNINTDATDLSKKGLGSTVKESAGVETDNHEKDKETSLIQEPELKLPVRKKKVKKPAAKNKDESLVKCADNIGSETSSIVPATTVDEKISAEMKNDKVSLSNAEKNEGLEKKLTDDVIMQEAETSKPTEVVVETSKPTEVVVETLKPTEVVVETSEKDLKDVVGSRKTKKDVGKSATIIDLSQKGLGSTVKESAGVETDNHEKDKETSLIQEPELKLPVRKKKVKKPAAKNKDESLVKCADNIGSETSSIVPATTVDEKISAEMKNDKVSLSNAEKNEGLEKKLTDDVIMQEAETSKPTEVVVETSKPTEVVVETLKPTEVVVETSEKDLKDVVGSRKTKKDVGKSATIIDLSQKGLGSTVKESAGVETDNHEKDKETSLIQEPELKLPVRKKKVKKPAAKNKDESLVKRADNIVSETSSIVPATTVDEKISAETKNDKVSLSNAEKNEGLEKKLTDDVIMQEAETSKPTEVVVETSKPTEVVVETLKPTEVVVETSKKDLKDVVGSRKTKKDVGKSATRTDLSKKGLGSTVKESAGVETDNHEKDKETSLIQEPELKLPVRKKKVKKPAAKNKDESLVKRADNIVSETSSIVPATTVDEKISAETKNDKVSLSNAEKNEGLEKKLTDDVIMQEAETSKPTEVVVETSKPTEVVVETLKPTEVVVETSKKDLKDVVGSRKTKKDVRKSATRTDAATVTNKEELLPHSEMKDSQDITSIDALHVDHGSKYDFVTNNDAEMSKTEKTTSQVNAEGIDKKSEKQNEKLDDKKVRRKKRKTKKSANNGEGGMSTAVSVPPLYDEAIYPKMALLHAAIEEDDQMKGKNEHVFDEGLVKKAKKSHKSSVTAPEDLPSKRQFTEPEVEPENIDHQTSKNLTVSEVSKNKDDVSNEVNISKDGSHKIDFLKSFTPGKDTTQSVKEKKPKKTKEPSLVDSRNDSAMQSQKLASKNENKKAPTDVLNGSNIPNTDQFKTPKKISKIDTSRTSKLAHANKAHGKPSAESLLNQKSNKQQSTLSQSSVKNVQKSAPVKNSWQHIKSLLNKPGSIFGGDSDESSSDDNATANSDSSTRTPSGMSSSGDSTTSIESRRKGSHADKRKSVGKDSTNSQSKSKGMTMADLLRSSSRFKKAKVTASQQARDTESQSVEFVPDSQP